MNARRRASLRPRSSLQRRAAPAHVAAGRLLQARDRARERRLAGAVGPDDGDELARVDVRSAAVEDLDVARAHVDVARLEQRRVTRPPAAATGTAARRARPSAARPAARSARARRARACRPATSSAAPATALAGITKRWLEVPPASRTRCGMTRPRKPSRPARAAALEASSAAATAAVSRTRRGWPPSEAATSSPSASRSSGRISSRREHEPDRHVRPDDLERAPPLRGQAAGEPEDRGLHAVAVGHHQRRRRGAEQRADADPGQDHAPDRPRVRARPADREDDRRGDQPEGERPDRQQRDRARPHQQRQHRAEARAAGDADHVRRGERVRRARPAASRPRPPAPRRRRSPTRSAAAAARG